MPGNCPNSRASLRPVSQTVARAPRSAPVASMEANHTENGRVSSQSLVRYDTNDYSVPVAYGHQDVWVRAYVAQVVIGNRCSDPTFLPPR